MIRRYSRRAVSLGSLVLATGIPAASAFLMTPLLIHLFGNSEFGEWALVEPAILFGAAALSLGAQFGGLNAVSNGRLSGGAAISSTMLVVGVAALVGAPVMAVAGGIAFGIPLAISTFINQFVDASAGSISSVLRAERRNFSYALIEGGRALALLLILFCLVHWQTRWAMNIGAVLLLRAVCAVSLIALLIGSGVVRLKRPDPATSWHLLAYGFPIFCAQLLTITAANADRYVVRLVGLSATDLTTYVAHARLAGILNILFIAPMNLWYPIEAMRRDVVTNQDFFFSVFLATVVAFAAVLPIVLISAPWFWPHVFPSVEYDPLLMLSILTAIGCQALVVVWNVGALRPGHTRWNVVPPLASILVLLFLGPLLGKSLGLVGVAEARLAATAAAALGILAISQRIAPIGMPVARLAPAFMAICLAVSLAVLPLSPSQKFGALVTIGACLAAGVVWNRAYFRALVRAPAVAAEDQD